MMIKRLLIANRGEIACRIIKTCKKMGIETVAIYSVCDKTQKHVSMADFSVCVGDNNPENSYLNVSNIIQAAISKQCDAIHPGYGFLSEDVSFVTQVEKSGLIFVGPSSKSMVHLNEKLHVKNMAEDLHIPIVKGSKKIITSIKQANEIISDINYPIIIKSNNGEGGKHIHVINNQNELVERFNNFKTRSLNGKYQNVYIESYLAHVKHIEVQLLADWFGNVVALGLRDCSLQHNHTKMIEESCNSLDLSLQQKLVDHAILIAKKLGINNACTVEFLVDSNMNHYFIEINPRIQVEHPISESITGIDIVKMQIESAQQLPLRLKQEDIHVDGHAIECRVYSKDIKRSFVEFFYVPLSTNTRVDSAIDVKGHIPLFYDGLIAKIIVHKKDRKRAISQLIKILHQTIVIGVDSNLDYLKATLWDSSFEDGSYSTQTLDQIIQGKQTDSSKALDFTSYHCEQCHAITSEKSYINNGYVCPICDFHPTIPAKKIAELLLDRNTIFELDSNLKTNHHHQSTMYRQKLSDAKEKSSSNEAIYCVVGTLGSIDVCLGVFEPSFMMGTLGSVVGEKISRLAEYAKTHHFPLIMISASGGARMQEGIEALMQMAKTTMVIDKLKEDGLFISVCTHPTMGGTTASFAMQGDIILAHPQATIGFSGKRVVEQTLKLPFDDSIQKAEVLQVNGWIDKIVSRSQLKDTLMQLLTLHKINTFKPIEKRNIEPVQDDHSTPWEIVREARNLKRIKAKELIDECFDLFVSLHNDILTDNPTLITGIGLFRGLPVSIIAQNKGYDINSKNSYPMGMMTPSEYRKVVRVIKQAEKFNRPIITIIDTPGANPSMESEISGQASAISDSLAAFSNAKVPIISVVLSEGGSGGALAIGISDITLMFEKAYYSIISPEGYASILYNDSLQAPLVANSMKITSHQLKAMNIVDDIIAEKSHEGMIDECMYYLSIHLQHLTKLDSKSLLELRYQKYRSIASARDA